MATTVRLNKYLADHGIASRRKADELIAEGQVMVNGQMAQVGQRIDSAVDTVVVGKTELTPLSQADLEYWVVYKPRGYVSTVKDPDNRPSVISLVHSKQRLYPVGRLDIESEGLLLLTNDGELTNTLTHPRYHIAKTYHVWVTGEVTEAKLNKLRSGVRLSDGPTAPCEIVSTMLRTRKAALTITLYEGRSRQIRRMMPQVDLEVTKLKRVGIGPVHIGSLRVGESRRLTQAEIDQLRGVVRAKT